MGFFNDFGKKTSETTSRIAKETKLKIKVNENKGKVNDLYKQIGQKVYEQYTKKEDQTDLKDLFKQVDSLLSEIEEANKEMLTLNNKKLCSNCQEELEKDAQFCQKCGTKQPEPEPAKEVEIVEEKKEDTQKQTTEEDKKTEN